MHTPRLSVIEIVCVYIVLQRGHPTYRDNITLNIKTQCKLLVFVWGGLGGEYSSNDLISISIYICNDFK